MNQCSPEDLDVWNNLNKGVKQLKCFRENKFLKEDQYIGDWEEMRKELEKGMELVTQDLVYQTKGFILYIVGSRALLTSSAGKYIRI